VHNARVEKEEEVSKVEKEGDARLMDVYVEFGCVYVLL
jgi:hypothetical protein